MGGILGWLDKFFTNAASVAVDTYLDVVHWAIRGITSLVFGQFNATASAWTVYYTDNNYFIKRVQLFAVSSNHAHGYTLQVRIPAILRWANSIFGRLFADVLSLLHRILGAIAMLSARIIATARAITSWVLRDVWAPLYAFTRKIYGDLLKWGYVAWWWITHLDALAEALIFHLALSMERNAWKLAGMLGKFVLSLVLRNALKLAKLVESIVVAVI